jgi:hypothetical protein
MGEAIHDPVNDKLPPWPKDHDRAGNTPTTLPVALARRQPAGGYVGAHVRENEAEARRAKVLTADEARRSPSTSRGCRSAR